MPYEVLTFGCRLNNYESEVIEEHLKNINIKDDIHILVFNSCAVTSESERQLKQSIRKKKKEFPESKIILTGCAAQINYNIYNDMEEIDFILGNDNKLEPFEYRKILENNIDNNKIEKIRVNDIMSVKETAFHLIKNFNSKTRAFIQIQNGCNHRCTFCIIPYGRGNSRSVLPENIIQQIYNLVQNNCNEIVLTGVDIGDYGKDLNPQLDLYSLIKKILKEVPELKRLRISSIDVAEINDDMIELLANENRIMPYLHLSLQSGDNMILKRMKRRHSREDVIEFCKKVKNKRSNITFGADIIAGFPTETEEMFENSLKIISEIPISFIHAFPYSIRKGTPASKMPQLNKETIKERAKKLRIEGEKVLTQELNKQIGTIKSCIIENQGILRSEDFYPVIIDNFDYSNQVGNIIKVKINSIKDNKELVGELIK